MSDVIDQAEVLESFYRSRSIEAARKPLQATPADQAECADCGEDIEAERRAALPAVRTCVFCQEARERRAREYRR